MAKLPISLQLESKASVMDILQNVRATDFFEVTSVSALLRSLICLWLSQWEKTFTVMEAFMHWDQCFLIQSNGRRVRLFSWHFCLVWRQDGMEQNQIFAKLTECFRNKCGKHMFSFVYGGVFNHKNMKTKKQLRQNELHRNFVSKAGYWRWCLPLFYANYKFCK